MDPAHVHKDWTVEGRKEVILSQETKTNGLSSDGRKWAHRLPGEGLTSRLVHDTLKFGGGSVMVLGCMSQAGVRNCCRMDGRMDGDLCTASYFGKTPSDTVFQQDNDPKHTCKKAKEWFKDSGIEVLPWPV